MRSNFREGNTRRKRTGKSEVPNIELISKEQKVLKLRFECGKFSSRIHFARTLTL